MYTVENDIEIYSIFSTHKHVTRVKCIATEIITSSLGNVLMYIFYSAWTIVKIIICILHEKVLCFFCTSVKIVCYLVEN